MLIKKVFLATLFLVLITFLIGANQQKEQSLFSYMRSSIENFFSTKNKPIDWQNKYKKKESFQTSKTPITDATISAQKFKTAIENAADKNSIMARFKNNPDK